MYGSTNNNNHNHNHNHNNLQPHPQPLPLLFYYLAFSIELDFSLFLFLLIQFIVSSIVYLSCSLFLGLPQNLSSFSKTLGNFRVHDILQNVKL